MAGVFSYEQSLFVRFQKQCPDSVLLLDTQYRMHPEISRFPNSFFYEGHLIDGPTMAAQTARPWHANRYLGAFRFFDVGKGQEDRVFRSSGVESKSKMNEAEARVAANIVAMLCDECPNISVYQNSSHNYRVDYKLSTYIHLYLYYVDDWKDWYYHTIQRPKKNFEKGICPKIWSIGIECR